MTHRQNRAPLLLIELMISIFLFAASAAAVVQIFAAAEKLSTRARNRFQAATMLQTAADAYIAADGDPEQTAALLDKVWNSPEAASSARSSSQSDHTAPETPSSAQTTHDDSAGDQTAQQTPSSAQSTHNDSVSDQTAQQTPSSAQGTDDDFAGDEISGETLTFYFDKDWNTTVSSDSASFLVVIRFQPDKENPRLGSAAVTISDADGGVLLTQTVTQYQAARTEVSP